MPTRPTRARPHTLLTAATTLAALALAAPAFAQTGTGSETPATGNGQSSQPRQSMTPDAGANDSDTLDGANRNDNASSQPAQQLPKPKSSDYGASNYNAPTDAELAQFTATHPTPTTNGDDTGNNSADGTTGTTADSPMADGASDDSASNSDDAMGAVSGDDGMSSANGSAPNNRTHN